MNDTLRRLLIVAKWIAVFVVLSMLNGIAANLLQHRPLP